MVTKRKKTKQPIPMAVTLIVLWTLGAGCQFYDPQYIEPEEFLTETLAARDYVPDSIRNATTFSFRDAAAWMSDQSPQLALIRQEYEIQRAVAETPVPFPNPSVEGGPSLNFHSPGGAFQKVQPYVSVGFVIPLGPRLGREDDFNQAKAMQAYQNILIGHRGLYLTLRENYIRHAVAEQRRILASQIALMAKEAEKMSRKLEDVGYIGALDVYESVVERGRRDMSVWEEEQQLVRKTAEMSFIIGTQPKALADKKLESLPLLPPAPPSLDSLRVWMLLNNPELAGLLTKRLVYDCEYRLELAKQIPDLVVGSNYGADASNIQTIGITVGMEIPVFDRNQLKVAETKASRDYVIREYKTRLDEKLNRLEELVQRYTLLVKKIGVCRNDLLPNAERSLRLAENGTQSGIITALQCLRVQRDYRDILREHLDFYEELWEVQLELERTVGYPLALFPSEEAGMVPNIELKDWEELAEEGMRLQKDLEAHQEAEKAEKAAKKKAKP